MRDPVGVWVGLIFLTPLLVAALVVRFPGALAVLGVLLFYAGGGALALPFLGIPVAASLIGSSMIVFGLCGAIAAIERRLDRVADSNRDVAALLRRIAHPEVPWPPAHPDAVMLEEWRGGRLWRLRADGRWEYREGKRWLPQA